MNTQTQTRDHTDLKESIENRLEKIQIKEHKVARFDHPTVYTLHIKAYKPKTGDQQRIVTEYIPPRNDNTDSHSGDTELLIDLLDYANADSTDLLDAIEHDVDLRTIGIRKSESTDFATVCIEAATGNIMDVMLDHAVETTSNTREQYYDSSIIDTDTLTAEEIIDTRDFEAFVSDFDPSSTVILEDHSTISHRDIHPFEKRGFNIESTTIDPDTNQAEVTMYHNSRY